MTGRELSELTATQAKLEASEDECRRLKAELTDLRLEYMINRGHWAEEEETLKKWIRALEAER